MADYSRQTSPAPSAGDTITAALLNDEFDEIYTALGTGGIGTTQLAALSVTNAKRAADLTVAKFDTNVADTDGTLAANSDDRLATQKAIKTYADAAAKIAQVVTEMDQTEASFTSTDITWDDTTPSSTEGTSVISKSFTATNTANSLFIEVSINVAHSATNTLVFALFGGTTCLCTATHRVDDATAISRCTFAYEYAATLPSGAVTYDVRGSAQHAGTTYINQGGNGNSYFNGTLVTSMKITEIVA